jgi:hypothetical protein
MKALVLAVAAALLAACSGDIFGGAVAPMGPGAGGPVGVRPGAGDAAGTPVIPALPAASTCQQATVGRSYRGLAGETLEADRLDADPSFDRLRPRPNPNHSNEWLLLSLIQIAKLRSAETTSPIRR